ncbi:class I SAM-dependent methyltransferase [Pseudaestuariivita sp.]|uniref:class I SAM-dependent methyltransferase n=1 Tax=Pseudaestuariivita sp. TaxID=2211669 RepID=UPI004058C042
MSARLALATEAGLDLTGDVLVVGAVRGQDLSALDRASATLLSTFYPDFAVLEGAGWRVRTDWPERAETVVVCLPRAKALALTWVAKAAEIATQTLVIDGQKTDGVESILKALRKVSALDGTLSKGHGKLFWCAPSDQIAALAPPPPPPVEGFAVAPGVFSADGIDPGSALLAEALPDKLGPRVADLGAGWGYVARQVLAREGVETLHLVEADHTALSCAKVNVADARAQFHWEDATTWRAPDRLDTVVMNPPFHTGRAATPDLGQAFVTAAARALGPRGTLWMVANRHLPYEETLDRAFAQVDTVTVTNGYKVLTARAPRRGR